MNFEKNKDKIIIFLLIVVILLFAILIMNQNKTAEISDRTTARLKAQLADSKKSNDKDVDPYEKNEVKNTILKGAADKIQVCYKEWIKSHPNFEVGKVALDWQIRLDGSVEKPEIIASDLPELNNCVIDAISSLKFPPPPSEKPWYIVHKFYFKKESADSSNAPSEKK